MMILAGRVKVAPPLFQACRGTRESKASSKLQLLSCNDAPARPANKIDGGRMNDLVVADVNVPLGSGLHRLFNQFQAPKAAQRVLCVLSARVYADLRLPLPTKSNFDVEKQ